MTAALLHGLLGLEAPGLLFAFCFTRKQLSYAFSLSLCFPFQRERARIAKRQLTQRMMTFMRKITLPPCRHMGA